jgi:type II restriction enzyme
LETSLVFTQPFFDALRTVVGLHHYIYPTIPPKGRYFEALVERACKQVRQPFTRVKPTTPNAPREDIIIGKDRFSLKTQTGINTHLKFIEISKLLTTEKEPWTAESLIERTLHHLNRYDYILMLRAVWQEPVIHYQLVDIPVSLLKLIETVKLQVIGRRTGRQSLGGDIFQEGQLVFHVHFDGSDGKCQIRRLAVSDCNLLFAWDLHLND